MRAMARPIRIAAAGDIHCSPENRERAEAAFAEVDDADLILLAGDLTTHGEPEQAAVLADIARAAKRRVVAVLGNHDWHANRIGEIVPLLEDAGVTILDPGWTTCEVDDVGVEVMPRLFFALELGDDGLRAIERGRYCQSRLSTRPD